MFGIVYDAHLTMKWAI